LEVGKLADAAHATIAFFTASIERQTALSSRADRPSPPPTTVGASRMSSIEILPLSGHLGAEVHGADLSQVDDALFAQIHRAFLDHAVVVFRDQKLSHEDQISLGRRFGELDVHPIAIGMEEHPEIIRVLKPAGERASFGTSWHTDNTFFEKPSMASVLYGVTLPPFGGDTLWASMEKAYEALSPGMKKIVDDLHAVHSASRAYDPAVTGEAKYRGEAAISYRHSDIIDEEVVHPVVRTHPETGRRGIFVNPMFTIRIDGLSQPEGDAILGFLYEHATRPEFTCRLQWKPGTVAIWDNRCTQHYAIDDYEGFERVMYRVTIQGDRPR
jgi:taurine dioxygenase